MFEIAMVNELSVFELLRFDCRSKSNLFPFRVDPFSERALCAGNQTGSHKICLPSIKWQIELLCVYSPLTLVLLNKLRCHTHF